MRWIDNVHPVTVFDFLAWHPDFLKDLVSGGTDRRFIHQIPAVPEPSAECEALFDDDGTKAHVSEIMGADQTGRPGSDDDDIALNELVEFFIVFSRDLSCNVAFAQGCWFWLAHTVFSVQRMLKTVPNFVLGSSKSSTYPRGYASGFDSPRALLDNRFEHPRLLYR